MRNVSITLILWRNFLKNPLDDVGGSNRDLYPIGKIKEPHSFIQIFLKAVNSFRSEIFIAFLPDLGFLQCFFLAGSIDYSLHIC